MSGRQYKTRLRILGRGERLLWSTRQWPTRRSDARNVQTIAEPTDEVTAAAAVATIAHGDCEKLLRGVGDDSIDLVCTDPPYGYSFAGLDWDRAVPSVSVWRECLRVMKPGAFAFVMSAPRLDVLGAMIERMTAAGFELRFTPLFWTYASGMPKAGDAAQIAMKRLGDPGRVVGRRLVNAAIKGGALRSGHGTLMEWQTLRAPTDPRAIALDGAKLGFQPKPAVEVVLVAMKPLGTKTFVEQALTNGKGVTWLEEGRIPGDGERRFPANLLVSDDILGAHSRFFSLDAWMAELPEEVARQLPFLVVKKVSRNDLDEPDKRHPTQKPVGLMSYLVTIGSRPGELVLDPFAGSGTTGVAARAMRRNFIGFEQDARWVGVARERLSVGGEFS